jgi:hypothetical protein
MTGTKGQRSKGKDDPHKSRRSDRRPLLSRSTFLLFIEAFTIYRNVIPAAVITSNVKMEALVSSETSEVSFNITRGFNPEVSESFQYL